MDAIDAAAAEWLARRDRGFTAEEQAEFSVWLSVNASHKEAAARLEASWIWLDQLRALAPVNSPAPNPDFLAPELRRRVLRFPVIMTATAAAIAALLALVAWWPRAADSPSHPATTIVENQRTTLPDGSVVDMNKGGAIEIQFTPDERLVRLVRGEASFTVAKNPARPFVVSADKVRVRAVGTVFNVRIQPATVEVLVTEGKVRVGEQMPMGKAAEKGQASDVETSPDYRSGSRLTEPLMVVAGQRAIISTTPGAVAPVVESVTPEEIEHFLAWQGLRLVFVEKPLGEVVEEFNRHNQRKLVIGDEELSQLKIGGSFRGDNVDAFVRLLENGFEISAEDRGNNEIVLHKAK